jgi:hypothetical protein
MQTSSNVIIVKLNVKDSIIETAGMEPLCKDCIENDPELSGHRNGNDNRF